MFSIPYGLSFVNNNMAERE